MSRRIVSVVTITPNQYADTTNLGSASFPFLLQGSLSTQVNKVWELSINGQAASSSSPTYMILGRDSTIAATNSLGSGQNDSTMDPAFTPVSNIPLTGNTSTTAPQRSGTLHLINASLNAFGGVYFWRANRYEECVSVLGNTASLGEVSLSAFTGGTPGAVGCHMIYETI